MDTVTVIGARKLSALLTRRSRTGGLCRTTDVPFLRLGVATFLKSNAGRLCTWDEIADWVWPAGPPDAYQKAINKIVHDLRKDGAPIERKNRNPCSLSRPGFFVWMA